MLHTANYDITGPHTTVDALVREVAVLAQALRDVNIAADDAALPVNKKLPSVPRDLVQYVEDGRNPDIYTREFVELVRRTNQIRAGKQASFAQFQSVLAGQIRSALPELSGDVDRVVAATGGAANAAGAAATAAIETAAVDADPSDAAAASTSSTATSTNTTTPAALASTNSNANAAAGRSTDSGSSRDGTPGVLTPGGSTPGPSAAGPGGPGGLAGPGPAAAAGVMSVDMLGILPSTPQPGTGATGAAATGAPASASKDTQMS